METPLHLAAPARVYSQAVPVLVLLSPRRRPSQARAITSAQEATHP